MISYYLVWHQLIKLFLLRVILIQWICSPYRSLAVIWDFAKKVSRKFYTDEYNLIVLASSLIFSGLTAKVATLLSSKFLDVCLAWNNEKKDVHSIYTKNLDDRELSGLQYIADYVLLNQKNRNLKKLWLVWITASPFNTESKKIFK